MVTVYFDSGKCINLNTSLDKIKEAKEALEDELKDNEKLAQLIRAAFQGTKINIDRITYIDDNPI